MSRAADTKREAAVGIVKTVLRQRICWPSRAVTTIHSRVAVQIRSTKEVDSLNRKQACLTRQQDPRGAGWMDGVSRWCGSRPVRLCFERVHHGLGVQTGLHGGRADDVAERGEGRFVLPDVDDSKAAVGAVLDVACPRGLFEDGRSAGLEDFVVLGDILAGEFENGDDGHGFLGVCRRPGRCRALEICAPNGHEDRYVRPCGPSMN